MYRLVVFVAVLLAFIVSGAVDAAGITGFKRSTLKVYLEEEGAGKTKKIKRGEIQFPARILTFRTDAGYIKATFKYKSTSKQPISGWVRYRSVRVDEGLTIDVPGCASPSKQAATVTRGVRGLGKGCK